MPGALRTDQRFDGTRGRAVEDATALRPAYSPRSAVLDGQGGCYRAAFAGLYLAPPAASADQEATITTRALSVLPNDGAWVYVRAQGDDAYALVLHSAGTLKLYRLLTGQSALLLGEWTTRLDASHTLRAVRDRLTVLRDGREVAAVRDAAITAAGATGFRVGNGSGASAQTATAGIHVTRFCDGPACTTQPDVCVHPDEGTDSAAGTMGAPVATAARALAMLGDQPGRVLLLPGRHPALIDKRPRTNGPVVIASAPGAELAGVTFLGATDLELEAAVIRGGSLVIGMDGTLARRAQRIAARGLEVSDTSTCVGITGGSQDVSLTDTYLHDAKLGIVGKPQTTLDAISEHLTFTGLRVERMLEDGAQIGHWRDVAFRAAHLLGSKTTTPDVHVDGMQLLGHVYDVLLEDFTAQDWRSHALIAQTDFGPSHGLVLRRANLGRTFAPVMQLLGVTAAEFYDVALTQGKDGALRVGAGRQAPAPTDVIADGLHLHATNAVPLSLLDGGALAQRNRVTESRG